MLAFTVTGELTLPPLVFLHGFLGVKEDWEDVAHLLKDKFCCYALDLPGHGCSEFDPAIVDSVYFTLNKLNLLPCPLVGYSMGGRVALLLKNRFPDSFSGSVILGAHPGLTEESEKQFRLQQDSKWLEVLETQSFSHFLNAWYAQPLFKSLSAELYAKILARRMEQRPENMALVLRNFSLALQPAIKHFPDALFLHGEHDDKFAELYRELPHSVIKNSGHICHMENPKAVAEKITHFMEKRHAT